MVANRLQCFIKSSVVTLFITAATFNFVYLNTTVFADQNYSRCTYSSGDYSGDENCNDESSNRSNQNIAGTGQEIEQIITIIIFLGLASFGFGLVYCLLRRKHKNSRTKDK